MRSVPNDTSKTNKFTCFDSNCPEIVGIMLELNSELKAYGCVDGFKDLKFPIQKCRNI